MENVHERVTEPVPLTECVSWQSRRMYPQRSLVHCHSGIYLSHNTTVCMEYICQLFCCIIIKLLVTKKLYLKKFFVTFYHIFSHTMFMIYLYMLQAFCIMSRHFINSTALNMFFHIMSLFNVTELITTSF